MRSSRLSVFSRMDSAGLNSLDGLRLEQRVVSTEIFTDGTGEDRLLDVRWMVLGV